MLDAYIYDGLRSPFGRHAGSLASIRPDDLAATVIQALIIRSRFQPEQIDDVLIGCTNQAGEDSRNVARNAALAAGVPVSVSAQTVNRLCGSGLAAMLDAARAITCGEGELLIAGGVESMSRAPFVMAKAEAAYSRDFRIYDSTLGSRFPNPRVTTFHGDDSMTQTADNVARDYGITRMEADRFALDSQRKYADAVQEGFFREEILPISVPRGRKSPPITVDRDEHPRPDTDFDALSKLKPLLDGGITTAGNASGINDGAAALLLGNAATGERAGVKPLARVVAGATAGVAPRVMGIGAAYAMLKVLQRAQLQLFDIDLIEINEAFAAQVLGCLRILGLPSDDSRLNPNGGAIAVGHPLGASGGRLALTAARQLQRSGGRFALIGMCIGVGQGIAVVIERI